MAIVAEPVPSTFHRDGEIVGFVVAADGHGSSAEILHLSAGSVCAATGPALVTHGTQFDAISGSGIVEVEDARHVNVIPGVRVMLVGEERATFTAGPGGLLLVMVTANGMFPEGMRSSIGDPEGGLTAVRSLVPLTTPYLGRSDVSSTAIASLPDGTAVHIIAVDVGASINQSDPDGETVCCVASGTCDVTGADGRTHRVSRGGRVHLDAEPVTITAATPLVLLSVMAPWITKEP